MKTSGWIPAHRREELRALASRSNQVVGLAALVGILTGLFVALFDRLVVTVAFDRVIELDLWLVAVMPAIGLLIALLARRIIGSNTSPGTSDEYLSAFHDRTKTLGLRDFAARTVAAIATLGSGAPMGLEGPSLYAGATFGANIQRRMPRSFRNADRRVLMVAGAAAGVAAIFKAPATGAVFAIEVPYQDDLARRMLLPAMVASATGYLTFVAIDTTAILFPIDGVPAIAIRDLLGAMLIGVIAGIGARGFALILRKAKSASLGRRPVLTTLVSGAVIGLMFVLGRILTGESLIVGSGYEVLTWAADPGRSVWIMLGVLGLRCLATSAAVAGGGVGGLFIPLVVAGALTGSIIGGAISKDDLTLFIVIGVAAFLGAGYRVPLAAVMFVAETTGRPSFIVPGLLAAVAAELVMGVASITSFQTPGRLRPTEEVKIVTSD